MKQVEYSPKALDGLVKRKGIKSLSVDRATIYRIVMGMSQPSLPTLKTLATDLNIEWIIKGESNNVTNN